MSASRGDKTAEPAVCGTATHDVTRFQFNTNAHYKTHAKITAGLPNVISKLHSAYGHKLEKVTKPVIARLP